MAEKSSFRLVFGNSPFIRVLDFLLDTRGFYDYSLTEIADKSGVSWATMNKIYPQLLNLGIIKQTRTISRAKMFLLNEKHPLVKELMIIDNFLSEFFMEIELAKQEGKKPQLPKMTIEPMTIRA